MSTETDPANHKFPIFVVGALKDALMPESSSSALADQIGATYEAWDSGHAVAEECSDLLHARLETLFSQSLP